MFYNVVAYPEGWKACVNADHGQARFASMMCSTHIVTIYNVHCHFVVFLSLPVVVAISVVSNSCRLVSYCRILHL
jgi:hypothetical protein